MALPDEIIIYVAYGSLALGIVGIIAVVYRVLNPNKEVMEQIEKAGSSIWGATFASFVFIVSGVGFLVFFGEFDPYKKCSHIGAKYVEVGNSLKLHKTDKYQLVDRYQEFQDLYNNFTIQLSNYNKMSDAMKCKEGFSDAVKGFDLYAPD